MPLFKEGLPFGLAQACMNQEHWPQTICQWQEAAQDEHKWYQVKKNLGLARTPKTRKDKKQLWKTALKGKRWEDNSVPIEVDTVQTQKQPLTEHQKKLMAEGRCFHCEVQGHLSRDCPKRANGPPPYSKARAAMAQTVATASTLEVATTKTETEEERIDHLVVELKGLNDDIQDKVLNGAFTQLEENF